MRKIILLIALLGFTFGMKSQITELQNGNVGIGTTNPGAKLSLYGTIAESWNSGIEFNREGGGKGKIVVDDQGMKFRTVVDGDGFYFRDNSNNTSLFIKDGGNIGVGTTNPLTKFHINGRGITLNRDSEYGQFIDFKRNDVNTWQIHAGIGVNQDIFSIRDGSGSSKLSILQSGNVGIGTTNPGAWKLAVNGNIRAKKVKVEAGWSDFVFYNDYNLPTLIEVENHIKLKGHLKDIPSAKEVAENGIFLGEMNAKLLQKIEELTLYTIQQQKEIERLKLIEERLSEIEKLLKSKKY